MTTNIYNLTRIEKHYMTEVMITYINRFGRDITEEEFAMEVEKMRNRRK